MSNICCAGPQLVKATFDGINGAGNITVPGIKAGDAALYIMHGSAIDEGPFAAGAVISTFAPADDTVQQTYTGDLTTFTLTVVFVRA